MNAYTSFPAKGGMSKEAKSKGKKSAGFVGNAKHKRIAHTVMNAWHKPIF
jgi:hypothetical protein